MTQALETAIEAAWEARADIDSATTGFVREAVEETLAQLDSGALRVAEKRGNDWHVNQWAKKAVLLGMGFNPRDFREGLAELAEWVASQTAVDNVEKMRAELDKRGLVA